MAIEYDPTTDFYVTLGIEDGATAEDIKKAHRARIRALHPDHGGDAARAIAVNLARDVLGEASTRREYDKARRAWFIEILKDPGVTAFLDSDGRLAAHFAAQQAAEDRQPRTTAPPSDAERAARHKRKWQWGLISDHAWPDVRKTLLAGDWFLALASLGTALIADRAIEVHSPAEQLAALDALIRPRQPERIATLMVTIAQALGKQFSRDLDGLVGQVRTAGRGAGATNARASRRHDAGRRSPRAR